MGALLKILKQVLFFIKGICFGLYKWAVRLLLLAAYELWSIMLSAGEILAKGLCEIRQFKLYHWGCIIVPFIRIYQLPFGDLVVHGYESMTPAYTYQAFWYYTWSRLLELFCFYAVARATKSVVFLLISIVSFGKIMDEGIYPFGFYFGEYVYWISAVIILLHTWRRNQEWHPAEDAIPK